MELQTRQALVLLLPSHSKDAFDPIVARLAGSTIPYLDLRWIKSSFTDKEFNASPFDHHPSARVYRAIGEALAEHLAH